MSEDTVFALSSPVGGAIAIVRITGSGAYTCLLYTSLDLDVDPSIPVAAIVSRLTGQKGLDLVERVLKEMMNIPIQLVVLGTGESRYENLFRYAQRTYPGRLAARIEYNDALARRIFAGADIFLVPSLFEPCGLTQMIAMRYGTVPIAVSYTHLDVYKRQAYNRARVQARNLHGKR